MVHLRRVGTGVRKHFHIRATEWVMLFATASVALSLIAQPDMFSISPTFGSVQNWFDELEWSFLLLSASMIRFIALFINGTFSGFRISPELRLASCLASGWFWSQFLIGVTESYLIAGGALMAVPLFGTFILMELINSARSTVDVTDKYMKRNQWEGRNDRKTN